MFTVSPSHCSCWRIHVKKKKAVGFLQAQGNVSPLIREVETPRKRNPRGRGPGWMVLTRCQSSESSHELRWENRWVITITGADGETSVRHRPAIVRGLVNTSLFWCFLADVYVNGLFELLLYFEFYFSPLLLESLSHLY